eukprot:TRINITY_DN14091_c2_g1_i1.p1 TRINITY_DN14091_c2_g1~~TRINITY_DN14091_c2_g1_i1.p1  ORF type:complete len:340 (+),score=84.75 TRINITY_DN14091_c2_g1_i1:159-1178(+)
MSISGTLKVFDAAKGKGIINYGGADILLSASDCLSPPKVGDELTFDIKVDAGQLLAKNVRGGTGSTEDESSSGDVDTSSQLSSMAAMYTMMNNMMQAMNGMGSLGSTAPADKSTAGGTGGTGAFKGVLKGWNKNAGFGFCQVQGSEDVYISIEDCSGGTPQLGDVLSFDVEPYTIARFHLRARHVKGGSGMPISAGGMPANMAAMIGGMAGMHGGYGKMVTPQVTQTPAAAPYARAGQMGAGTAGGFTPGVMKTAAEFDRAPEGRVTGVIKTWFEEKRFGFATIPGTDDVFIHSLQCRALGREPAVGDQLEFTLEQSKKNNGKVNWTAKNATWPGGFAA